MGSMDYQFGVKTETVVGTEVVVDRFYEYQDSVTPLVPRRGRTESNPFRGGSRFRRGGRAVPYDMGGEGTLELDVLGKGFGWWLTHMLGDVATSGAGPFVHTGTEGATEALIGQSFTGQVNYPFTDDGANQAITFAGGKVAKWRLGNQQQGMLRCSLDLDFISSTTGTALASASYPSEPVLPLSWVGAVLSIGGTAVDVTDCAFEVDNGLLVNRFRNRAVGTKKEQNPGPASGTFALTADWEALTQYNRVHSATIAGMTGELISTWDNGTDSLVVTVPGARFDVLDFAGEVADIQQALSGVIEYDGTDSGVTIEYTTSDATP